ncbi:hypothetical protein BJ875DRAFT_437021 [Amylocarpus encephaloides]|uniref:Uncharacterized protein n=1 Tax=Amylocarpus encephaloides TaxID=45428 RepID=A0A9P8C9H0_9HELO|nr:hypothetical protein BJ875DRAFT_437021 [Amylocarpus encephaloides]
MCPPQTPPHHRDPFNQARSLTSLDPASPTRRDRSLPRGPSPALAPDAQEIPMMKQAPVCEEPRANESACLHGWMGQSEPGDRQLHSRRETIGDRERGADTLETREDGVWKVRERDSSGHMRLFAAHVAMVYSLALGESLGTGREGKNSARGIYTDAVSTQKCGKVQIKSRIMKKGCRIIKSCNFYSPPFAPAVFLLRDHSLRNS